MNDMTPDPDWTIEMFDGAPPAPPTDALTLLEFMRLTRDELRNGEAIEPNGAHFETLVEIAMTTPTMRTTYDGVRRMLLMGAWWQYRRSGAR